ncbi:MAG: hypothetical protein ACFFDX_16235 [Candidatus Odinarchaeota archaeon]
MAKSDEIENDEGEKVDEIKDKPIYVKVSDETRTIIDKYRDEKGMTISNLIANAIKMYDEYNAMAPEIQTVINKHKEEDESIISFMQKAIQFYGLQKDLDRDIFLRLREEMKMMLIGKTTFNQLIAAAAEPKKAVEMPHKKNVALDLIMWYNNSRPLKNLTIEEIMKTIQKIWVVANYFYTIDITKESEDEYHMLFRHRQDKRYSKYWLGYFTELFKSKELSCKCLIEGQAFDESISMTIKIGYEEE